MKLSINTAKTTISSIAGNGVAMASALSAKAIEDLEDLQRKEIGIRDQINDRLETNQELLTDINSEQEKYDDKISKADQIVLTPHPKEAARLLNIEVQLMYWRKANAIHKWFVDNVQKGTDDCGTYEVSTDKLKELLDIINEILSDKSKAKSLLPTTNGFFFGIFRQCASWQTQTCTKRMERRKQTVQLQRQNNLS